MRATISAALLGAALLLGGCGIKGPLYLPERPAPVSSLAAADATDHSKAHSARSESR